MRLLTFISLLSSAELNPPHFHTSALRDFVSNIKVSTRPKTRRYISGRWFARILVRREINGHKYSSAWQKREDVCPGNSPEDNVSPSFINSLAESLIWITWFNLTRIFSKQIVGANRQLFQRWCMLGSLPHSISAINYSEQYIPLKIMTHQEFQQPPVTKYFVWITSRDTLVPLAEQYHWLLRLLEITCQIGSPHQKMVHFHLNISAEIVGDSFLHTQHLSHRVNAKEAMSCAISSASYHSPRHLVSTS